ncbi:PEP/pyruvate-binding domain-containing protein [Candidatus Leptofilum sp.]|uniref:PEP/pyruvate-binding domain-containing protein n=1 Tax=Candidatus Leptofilum sp. TaxID=3241576 RepID=UPI003B59E537
MTVIAPFHTLGQKDIPLAGGKGANLGEMTAAGFPVPPGFVLTTAAYDAFVKEHGLQQQIVGLARTVSASDPQSGEAASAKIKQLFLAAEVPAETARAVLTAYENLNSTATAVAVRSSATAEDLPDASFAGQQETYLNVQGKDALLEAVKKCWASLWTARAIAYRLRQAIDPNSVSLAVVVQQLVPGEASGILFTANPVNGQRDQLLINATWGLGEAIVSGQVTPDSLIVDKATWKILSSEITTKAVMTVRTDAGTEEQAVPVELQTQRVLDEGTAVSLAKLATKIEAHYNLPMDIEWAIANGEIAILQARPITSLPDPKPEPLQNVVWEPIVPNTVWMRRQIVEHMPQPLSPLFEDLYLRQGLTNAMNFLMEALESISGVTFDFNKMIPHGFAGTINGYAYTTGSFTMDFEDFKGIMRIYGRLPQFLNMNAFDWDSEVLPDYLALITHWEAKDLTQETDQALLQGIADMAAADGYYWFGSARNLGFSRLVDPFFDKLLKSPLIRHALPESRRASAAFLRGFDSKALDAQADMEAIAILIRNSETLPDLVLKTEANALISALNEHPEGQPVLDNLQQFLNKYGHQIYNLDFAEPTQTEDPLPILLSLKALVKNPPAQDVRTRQAKMAKERDVLVAQTEQQLNPLSLSIFRWVWKWTKKYAPYRENVMFYMGAAWPTLRKLAKELGQRLTDAGAIATPDDIYYLDSSEINLAIAARANGAPMPSFAQRVKERRTLREARKLLTPQPAVPPRGSLKMGPFDLSMFDPTPHNSATEGAILRGYAVSTGQVTAPATVIHSAADFDKMQPGTILVCTTTTPAWTPLFSQAIGLVTDVGGALAHGSIVAREYGIPAVMGTGVATERIKTGTMLKVDGDAGTVTLVDEFDPVEEQRRLAQKQAEQQAAAKRRKVLMAVIAGFIAGLIWWRRRK